MKKPVEPNEEPIRLTPEQLAMIDEAERSLAEGRCVSGEEAFAQIRRSSSEGVKIPACLVSVISIDPEVMHGKPCFKGTRVPLLVLLDNLEEGMGIDEFVREYPSVGRDQAEAVVSWRNNALQIGLARAF